MHRASRNRLTATARAIVALAAATALPAFASSTGLVISQVYGAGGNSGATLNADYVELLNTTDAPISLSGLSVQYASSAGNFGSPTSNVLALSGTVLPKHYFLVSMATGSNGSPLPAADAIGTLTLSGSAGKVALANATTALNCGSATALCSSSVLVDLVAYGSGASQFEGAGAAPTLTATTAAFRAAGGCTDTDNNAADFTAATPAPRNSASAASTCTGGGGGGGGGANPHAIWEIQGNGAQSPYVGKQVTATGGVVTKVMNTGFFIQALISDNDPSTSDGVFVYTGSQPTVAVGDLVDVTATVAEYNVGASTNADTAAHTMTELSSVTAISSKGTGYASQIQPVFLQMPLASEDALEPVEGMLVTMNGPFTVQQNYFLGRFGELTLATNGRRETPTNRYRPGTDANALNADNIRNSILLDDGTSVQDPNPTPFTSYDYTARAGDTITSVTGVVDYGLTTSSSTDAGLYKIEPTVTPTVSHTNPRTAAPGLVGGNIRVASANVLNFFTTLDATGSAGCAPSGTRSDCRGADSQAEFDRQRTKIVNELVALNADVVGLMELQNNGTVAAQSLVDGLNAYYGAGTYAVVPVGDQGAGTDAIQVGMLYKPGHVALVGGKSRSDAAAINNRAPLAGTFMLPNGESFNVVVNHLKSKGCDGATGLDLDQGDLQGCWNDRRRQQVTELKSFVQRVQAETGVAGTLLIGDFNSYAKEDPINDLTTGGFVDQVGKFNGFGYSYVFNGASGRLDQGITNTALSTKVTGALEWHNNADEPEIIDYNLEYKQPACATCSTDFYVPQPWRASDHDPVLVGLDLRHAVNGTSGRDKLVGTVGDDVITGGVGADTLTGNGGHDTFVYTSMNDGQDTITDFGPNDDHLDLAALLASIGASPVTAGTNGVVTLRASGADTIVMIDTDGTAGGNVGRPLVTLKGVAPSAIDLARDFGLGSTQAVNAARRAQAKAFAKAK